MPQTITFSVNQNRHPDCELPGICPFCANSTWCENSSEHGKVSVKFLRWLCGFVVLVILAMATCAKANAGTISGNIQTATGAGVTNGTLGFTLPQRAALAVFPQTWCTYGALTGTINVSNGAPNGNCSTAGVFYPTPLFSTSPTGA